MHSRAGVPQLNAGTLDQLQSAFFCQNRRSRRCPPSRSPTAQPWHRFSKPCARLGTLLLGGLVKNPAFRAPSDAQNGCYIGAFRSSLFSRNKPVLTWWTVQPGKSSSPRQYQELHNCHCTPATKWTSIALWGALCECVCNLGPMSVWVLAMAAYICI